MTDSDPTFERLTLLAADAVGGTFRTLPAAIRGPALGVAVHYERLPSAEVIAEGFPADILGLFSGDAYGTELSRDLPQPPQILLYLQNLWEFAEKDVSIFEEEVRTTYLHELGHYFGWDEDDVAARGLE